MTNILIVGAGKSSSFLILDLLKTSQRKNNLWNITIADSDEATLLHKVSKFPEAAIAVLDITNEPERQKLVNWADIVVSLMPPQLHILLAKDCLQFKKNLITSSYASPEMKELDKMAKEAGLMFMCEMGLDPGIDHMTASFMFDSIKRVVSDITSFKSYCGGLIAPESDDNPWHYKFSWNPRNIINAGKEGAQFLKSNAEVYVPYESMFKGNDIIDCGHHAGKLAFYPNRDSLAYIDKYNLHTATEFLRATLRHPDFCRGWNALIEMKVTNTNDKHDTDKLTYRQWMARVLGYNNTNITIEQFAWQKLDITSKHVQNMILWLDLFSDNLIGKGIKSSGDILLEILMDKWKMADDDKDMVVMQHEIKYLYKGKENRVVSNMVVVGENSEFSAMAKTVGLPMSILTELVVNKKIRIPTGVLIPNMPEVYRPVMKRLEHHNILFFEDSY
jgi:saccharopine dehydrogenase-like NADP-dependent oxidoreductase